MYDDVTPWVLAKIFSRRGVAMLHLPIFQNVDL